MTCNNIIFISYGVPLVALNILTVISIISIRKSLSTTSFYIYILTSAVNLLTYLNVWFSLRLYEKRPFNFYYHFPNQTFIIPLIQDFLCYFAQNINSALLTIDRYVSIAALDWEADMAEAFYDSSLWTKYVYDAGTDTYSRATKSTRIPIFVGLEVITGFLFIALCACLNIAAWIRLKNSTRAKIAERSFVFISLLIFVSQSVNIVIVALYFQFFVITYNLSILWGIFTAMLYTSDVFSLGPGVYMLVVPGPIRRRAVRFFSICRPGFRAYFKPETQSSVVNTIV